MWRRRLIGLSRPQIARILGEPRAACVASATTQFTIWDADVWYFPFDFDLSVVAAIEFRDGEAMRILHVAAPAQSRR
jgi:hypothetical protein